MNKMAQIFKGRVEEIEKENNNVRIELRYLYPLFLKHRGKPLSEFISSIDKDFKKKINEEILKNYIDEMKKHYYPDRGCEMEAIYNLSVALESKDDLLIEFRESQMAKIDNTKRDRASLINSSSFEDKREMQREVKQEKLEKCKVIMNKVINNEELGKDEVVNSSFNSYVKNNVKDFDMDLYMDYIIKVNNIETLDEKEIDQFIYMLDYFINHLTSKLEQLRELNPSNEEDYEKIQNIAVEIESKYSEEYLSKISNVYRCKLNRLIGLLGAFKSFKQAIIDIKETGDYNHISKIKASEKKYITEEDYMRDFYENLANINKVKKQNIDGLIVAPSTGKIYNQAFVKKLIRNNN